MVRGKVGDGVVQPVVLKSSVLGGCGVPHGFSTRVGGVSAGVFASLNFGNPSDLPEGQRDSRETIARNFGLLLGAVGAEGRRVVQVHQVHGAAVHVVRRGAELSEITWGDVKADAIVTDEPRAVVAVRVADCTPVLLSSEDGGVVGAVHAGWRGVVGGVVERAVEVMRGLGARGIVGAIGPCISGGEFEIGEEVVRAFRGVFGDDGALVWEVGGGKGRADMKACLARQLAGVGVERVEVVAGCTVRDAELFYSHRRERGVTGRMVGVIGARG